MTRRISEVQYNNWGNGVWNSLLAIQGTGNCSDSSGTQNEEYHKACIKKDVESVWDLTDMWNSDYWKTYYDSKLTNTTDKQKFLKLGSWEKFRELCTKGIDEMIRKREWSKLSSAVSANSSHSIEGIAAEDCLKTKPEKKK